MNLLASFALGGFNPWAAGFGIGSLVLFGLVGLVAGPNLKNFESQQDSNASIIKQIIKILWISYKGIVIVKRF